jgi:hypothetical protein
MLATVLKVKVFVTLILWSLPLLFCHHPGLFGLVRPNQNLCCSCVSLAQLLSPW